MLEALQQEEYQEERAHVQQLEDVDEDFIVYPADDSGVWNETILNVFFFPWECISKNLLDCNLTICCRYCM